MSITSLRDERGFTMIELLVASVTMVVVLGGAVAITSQVQQGYRRQLEDSAAEQEARYALDWIGKYIRAADNNPFGEDESNCPAATAPNDVIAIQFDPNLDGEDNDVRLMTDANPPDGLFGGPGGVGGCTQANEDVTISLDADTNTIVFLDNNTGGAVSTRTDTVIEDLEFVFRNSARGVLDTSLAAIQRSVFYVETRIRIRTRTIDARTGQPETRVSQFRSKSEKPNMMTTPIVHARSERGIALVVVLLLMAVLSGLATGFAMNGQVESSMAVNEVYYAGARAAAEAGMNRAIEAIRLNTDAESAGVNNGQHRLR